MAHLFIELYKSSRKVDVTNTSMGQNYVIRIVLDENLSTSFPGASFLGASDDVIALEYAYSILPAARVLPDYFGNARILILRKLGIEQVGSREWEVSAEYSYNIQQGTGGDPSNDDDVLPYTKINFTVGGGSKNIKKSLEVVSNAFRNDAPGVPPLQEKLTAIGVSDDGIEGTDVPDDTFLLQITGYFAPPVVTLPYVLTLRDLIKGTRGTGTYNGVPYLGAAIGEVQLRSVSGGGTVVDIIPLTFEFAISPNIVDQEDEGFSNIDALGFDVIDYLFVHEFDEDDSKKMLIEPLVRTVHRVHSPANYLLTKLPFTS